LRRSLLAASAVVLLGVLVANLPLAYAANPEVVDDLQYDLRNSGGRPAPSQFYLDFIDIAQASATLEDDIYTFKMTLWGTPDGWLENEWVPAFTSSPVPIERVRYQWVFVDSDLNTVGAIRITFRVDLGGDIRVNAMVCVPPVPDLPDQSMADCGPESYIIALDPDSLVVDQDANSISLTISEDDFDSLFQNAVYWRAVARVWLTTMGVAMINDGIPRQPLPAPPG